MPPLLGGAPGPHTPPHTIPARLWPGQRWEPRKGRGGQGAVRQGAPPPADPARTGRSGNGVPGARHTPKENPCPEQDNVPKTVTLEVSTPVLRPAAQEVELCPPKPIRFLAETSLGPHSLPTSGARQGPPMPSSPPADSPVQSRHPARSARSPPASHGGAVGLLGRRLLLRGLLGRRGGLGPLLVLGLGLVPLLVLVLVLLLFLLLLLLPLWLVHRRLRQGGQLLVHGLQLEDTGRWVRTAGWAEGPCLSARVGRCSGKRFKLPAPGRTSTAELVGEPLGRHTAGLRGEDSAGPAANTKRGLRAAGSMYALHAPLTPAAPQGAQGLREPRSIGEEMVTPAFSRWAGWDGMPHTPATSRTTGGTPACDPRLGSAQPPRPLGCSGGHCYSLSPPCQRAPRESSTSCPRLAQKEHEAGWKQTSGSEAEAGQAHFCPQEAGSGGHMAVAPADLSGAGRGSRDIPAQAGSRGLRLWLGRGQRLGQSPGQGAGGPRSHLSPPPRPAAHLLLQLRQPRGALLL